MEVPEGEDLALRTAPREFKALMLSDAVLAGLAQAGSNPLRVASPAEEPLPDNCPRMFTRPL